MSTAKWHEIISWQTEKRRSFRWEHFNVDEYANMLPQVYCVTQIGSCIQKQKQLTSASPDFLQSILQRHCKFVLQFL